MKELAWGSKTRLEIVDGIFVLYAKSHSFNGFVIWSRDNNGQIPVSIHQAEGLIFTHIWNNEDLSETGAEIETQNLMKKMELLD